MGILKKPVTPSIAGLELNRNLREILGRLSHRWRESAQNEVYIIATLIFRRIAPLYYDSEQVKKFIKPFNETMYYSYSSKELVDSRCDAYGKYADMCLEWVKSGESSSVAESEWFTEWCALIFHNELAVNDNENSSHLFSEAKWELVMLNFIPQIFVIFKSYHKTRKVVNSKILDFYDNHLRY